MSVVEMYHNGARMARDLAAKCNDDPAEQARHIERAEWYEAHARMWVEKNEMEQKEAAE